MNMTYGNYLSHIQQIHASINFTEQMLRGAKRKIVAASKDKTSEDYITFSEQVRSFQQKLAILEDMLARG